MQWPQHPYSRVALSFCAGIFIWHYFDLEAHVAYLALLIFSISWIIFERFYRNIKDQALISSILMLSTIFFAGSSLLSYRECRLAQQRMVQYADAPIQMVGTITEQLNSVNKLRLVIKCQTIMVDGKWKKHDAHLVGIFDQRDTLALQYRVGNKLGLHVKPLEFRANTNPDALDYAQFMKNKGVFQYAYVKAGEHFLVASSSLPWYQLWAQKAANFVAEVINKYLKDGSSKAIAEALLIGKQSDIDGETYQAYAQTGAIHVLSVSGLHVAIFIGGFIWAFSQIKNRSWIWKLGKLLILLLLVWFYAMMTGLAPSVVRAGVMISLYLIGKEIFKGKDNYNILSVSAIIMLIYNPLYLFQLSFQFSFISLLSILYFQPIIKKWYVAPNKYVDFVWSLINVSIAAQILIFPFTVYYFHQFPVYFALSGMVAVPIVSFIIYLGSAGVILEKIFPYLSKLLFLVLDYFIYWLNGIIKWISQLPFALIENIWLTDLMLLLSVSSIILMMIWVENRHFNVLKLAMLSMLVALGLNSYNKIESLNQHQLVIYDVNQGCLVDMTKGRRVHRSLEGDLDLKQIDYVSKNHLIKTKIQDVIIEKSSFVGDSSYLTYVYLDHKDFGRLKPGIQCEHLVITKACDQRPADILAKINPSYVILAKNLPNKIRQNWQNLQQATGIGVHDIKSQGAYLYQSQ